MEKLKMQTVGKVDANVAKIAALFPNCVTEAIVDDKLTRVVDFDLLKTELSNLTVESNDERFQFTWADKRQSILLANAPISKTLRPCRAESVSFDDTRNLYIEGDNLEVLKLLQETYMNKVKLIYIDPPYNTGGDFLYEDDFSMSATEYLERSGTTDEDGSRLFQNNDSNGRFHTDWLNMIYPRLKLARDLLTENGVIFISIDDNEVHNLRKVCDEVFGAKSFIGEIAWLKGNAQNDAHNMEKNHEYILCYSRSSATAISITRRETKDLVKEGDTYWYLGAGITTGGAGGTLAKRLNLGYTIYYNPTTGEKIAKDDYDHDLAARSNKESEVYTDDQTLIAKGFVPIRPPKKGMALGCWTWSLDKFMAERDSIYIRKGISNYTVYKKVFVDSFIVKNNGGKYNCEITAEVPLKSFLNFSSGSGTAEANSLLGGKLFDNPKPVDLIRHIVSSATKDDDIVLDFFGGSGTTAQAVMQQNAEDKQTRRFILVQLPEKTDEFSEAHKAGYETIFELGLARIKKAGEKIVFANRMIAPNLDAGFRVLRVDTSNMKPVFYTPDAITQDLFSSLENNIKDDRTAEDLLFQVMLDMGIDLSSDIKVEAIGGKMVYTVGGNNLVCCFEAGITKETVTEIAKRKPLYAIFRDSGFERDDTLVSFDQIFATYSPTTERRVL